MKLYVVCIDSHWIRDAQMLDTRDMTDDRMNDFDPFSNENNDRWYDIKPTAYIGMIVAESQTDACRMIANKYRYDHRTLYAIPADAKEAETV